MVMNSDFIIMPDFIVPEGQVEGLTVFKVIADIVPVLTCRVAVVNR